MITITILKCTNGFTYTLNKSIVDVKSELDSCKNHDFILCYEGNVLVGIKKKDIDKLLDV